MNWNRQDDIDGHLRPIIETVDIGTEIKYFEKEPKKNKDVRSFNEEIYNKGQNTLANTCGIEINIYILWSIYSDQRHIFIILASDERGCIYQTK